VLDWNKRLLKNVVLPMIVTLVALLAIFILVYQNANKEWRLAQLANASFDLEQKANIDALTGLPNRSSLDMKMLQLFAIADRTESLVAVLYVDLDRFKEVNDNFGHAVGDQLLKVAADRLTGLVRQGDVVARIGGDEFIILLGGLVSESPALALAQDILDSMAMPFVLEGKLLQLGASIGLAFYPAQNRDSHHLIHYADIAMYQAKRQGRNCYAQYDASMEAVFK
jgi:diguanylate cyclase